MNSCVCLLLFLSGMFTTIGMLLSSQSSRSDSNSGVRYVVLEIGTLGRGCLDSKAATGALGDDP